MKGSVSWLLHLIHLSFDTDRNQRVCIRIFGIPVNGRFHTKKKKFQKRRKVKQKRKASGSTKVQRKESVSPAKVQKAVESSTTAGEPKEAGEDGGFIRLHTAADNGQSEKVFLVNRRLIR